MFKRKTPPLQERTQAIVALLGEYPQGLKQGDIARYLNYPAKMVMEDLQRLEAQQILLCDDGTGRLQLFDHAWR